MLILRVEEKKYTEVGRKMEAAVTLWGSQLHTELYNITGREFIRS